MPLSPSVEQRIGSIQEGDDKKTIPITHHFLCDNKFRLPSQQA
jgi:hypothetical protein